MTKIISEFRGENFFLSNFCPCEINYMGISYRTLEHSYQAAKSLDKSERLRISRIWRPGDARKAGQTTLEVRPNWKEIRVEIMELLLCKKFSQEEFKNKLIATGDAKISHEVWWNDKFWGVKNGVGEDMQGILLMKIRDKLIRGENLLPHF